jgi:protein SCO1/2
MVDYRRVALAVSTLSLLVLATSAPANIPASSLAEVGIDQHLNEQLPLDLRFRDETGQTVQLAQYFGSTPVILVLAYYECPMLCPLVFDGLVKALRVLSLNVGEQFTVIAVSIDPDETPPLATAKKQAIVQRYARPGTADGWHFLTGDASAIARLTQTVGFRYAYDAPQDQYAHASGVMVLTPQGKLARYFYGIEYAPRDLRLGLVEAAANTIGSVVDQLLLLCYHYDPATGKYSVLTLNVIRVGGVVTVLALGTFIGVAIRRHQ